MMILASSLNLQFLSGPDISLPRWLFWLMVAAIGVLFLLLLIRDKGLRKGIKNLFIRGKKRMARARVQKKIKLETQTKLRTQKDLGKKAWETSVRNEASASFLDELSALEEKKAELAKETGDVDAEITKLKTSLEEFLKEQGGKISALEEEKKPHAERLGQVQELHKKALADLSHIDKEILQADKEKQNLARETERVEKNTELSEEIRDSKVQELKARIFDLEKKREEFETKLPDLRETESNWKKEITREQELLRDFNGRIKVLQDEEKERRKDSDAEIKKWQKKKSDLQAQQNRLETKKDPLYEGLGQALMESRVESPDLAPLYSRLEQIEEVLADLESRLTALKP